MNFKNYLSAKAIAISAIIAALYVVLTLINPFSFGQIQCRVSEAMTILPIFTPLAIPGLFIGCLVSNIIGGLGIIDVVLGTLATLLAALFTYKFRNKPYIAMLGPVIFNAIIIGLVLYFTLNLPLFESMLFVGIGEFIAVYALGTVLKIAIEKTELKNLLK